MRRQYIGRLPKHFFQLSDVFYAPRVFSTATVFPIADLFGSRGRYDHRAFTGSRVAFFSDNRAVAGLHRRFTSIRSNCRDGFQYERAVIERPKSFRILRSRDALVWTEQRALRRRAINLHGRGEYLGEPVL